MKLEDFSLKLAQLLSDIDSSDPNSYVRDSDFKPWVEKFNTLVREFNLSFSRQAPFFELTNARFTASGKTIKTNFVTSLKKSIILFKQEIDGIIQRGKDSSNRFRCFKIGHKCPHEIDSQKHLFFVGMPFDSQYVDSYQFGIKTMLDQHGIDTVKRVFKADEQPSTIDILCKICKGIQESQYIIINISGRNPNVMFELGLAYGLNKTVFLIKDENSAEISDLKGLEYTQYSNAADLANKLQKRFRDLGII